MKNITLSADENLIEAARRRAAAERTTLNAQFRLWLADYVGRERQAARACGGLARACVDRFPPVDASSHEKR